MRNRFTRRATSVVAAFAILAVARPALAGACRPLCLALDIADARTLPWGNQWWISTQIS